MRPKTKYIRSKALLEACRAIPCQCCGIDDGTVVAAHSNWHGKGMAIKASDDKVASLCYRCHASLDQGSKMSKEDRLAMWTDAHTKTVDELKTRGLWPKGL